MSLLELLIVIIILGITSSFAIANFSTSKEKQIAQQYVSQLIDLLKYVKTQSLIRNQTLILCGSNNDNNCNANWQDQIILTTGQQTLKSLPAAPKDLQITVSAFPNNQQLTFNPDGLLGTSNASITFRSPYFQQKITLSRTGRIA